MFEIAGGIILAIVVLIYWREILTFAVGLGALLLLFGLVGGIAALVMA